ncbi:MAG: prepilin-type N-terminal cleavage/methylation domain-containing protein, partial [Verrucomicrobiaceae bacterium]
MKTNPRHGKPGFTLIELMAVITIIVILAALVVVGLESANQKQSRLKATVQLTLLTKGLEQYKLDMASYPVSANTANGLGQSGTCLYQALFRDGYDFTSSGTPPATWNKATTIYVPDLDPTSSKQGWVTPVTASGAVPPAATPVIDPWGKEYRYRSVKNAAGNANSNTINPEFDLWTSGRDQNTDPGTPTATSNKDDIRNFTPPTPSRP